MRNVLTGHQLQPLQSPLIWVRADDNPPLGGLMPTVTSRPKPEPGMSDSTSQQPEHEPAPH